MWNSSDIYAYANYVNLIGDDIRTIDRNARILV